MYIKTVFSQHVISV